MNKPPRRNEFLRQARLERSWTQSDLAEELDVGKQTVQSWELGTRIPSLQLRRRLCALFSKTPEQLGLQLADQDEQISRQSSLLTAGLGDATLYVGAKGSVVTGHVVLPLRGVASRFVLDENRQRMLKRVRSCRMAGILESSLSHAPLIVLGLQEQPDAVENPWRLTVAEVALPPRLLPAGTRITQVYDEADGEVLILGEPGAGKTTLLLELARDLLLRAEEDGSYPLPVIFHLSSWAIKQQPLAQWLAEELSTKYRVPLKIGKAWTESTSLLVLLDGLDEVAEEARSACVKAINAYQQAHGFVPMVVCCRTAEYFAQGTRVAFQRAVLVQPLTVQQIDEYLSRIDGKLEEVRKALDVDPELREMVKTPLMLSIVTVAYQGEARATDVPVGSIEAHRQQIFATYVQRMLGRRGTRTRYTEVQTISWLAWLAHQLVHHRQVEFYLERMQPDWVPDSHQYRKGIIRFMYGMECALIAGLYGWIHGGQVGDANGVGAGLLGRLGSGPGDRILGWMAPGLGRQVEGERMFGLLLGIVFIVVIVLLDVSSPVQARWSWAYIRQSVASGLLNGVRTAIIVAGMCSILFLVITGNLRSALAFGAQFGCLIGTMSGLLSALVVSKVDHFMDLAFVDQIVDGLVIGGCGGLSFGIVNGLFIGASQGFINGLVVGLASFIVFGLGGGRYLIRDLGSHIKPAETTSWSWQSVRRHLVKNLVKGLLIGLSVAIIVGVITGIVSSFFYFPTYGWMYGLVYGPIVGSTAATASLLAGILNSGWSSDILDERQLIRPNDGICRSAHNSLFAAFLFGPLGGMVCGMVCGLSFGLIGRLTGWRILGIGFAIVFGIIFTFQLLLLRGGIACIEHYALRLHLWRLRSIPWHYVRFLDYAAERILLRKVEGGYLFVHRLFLDYFAALYPFVQGKDLFPKDEADGRPGDEMQQTT